MVAHNDETDKVDNQLAEDDGKLVPRHQGAAQVAGGHLGNIHGTEGRSHAYANAAKDTVKVEGYQQPDRDLPFREEKKLGVEGPCCRKEEAETCDKERPLTSQPAGQNARDGATYHAAYQG